jgi:hypothetical protein
MTPMTQLRFSCIFSISAKLCPAGACSICAGWVRVLVTVKNERARLEVALSLRSRRSLCFRHWLRGASSPPSESIHRAWAVTRSSDASDSSDTHSQPRLRFRFLTLGPVSCAYNARVKCDSELRAARSLLPARWHCAKMAGREK